MLDQPPGHPQRAFCADVLQRMVGLSYWEHLKDGWAQAVDPETRQTRPIKKVGGCFWRGLEWEGEAWSGRGSLEWEGGRLGQREGGEEAWGLG